MCIFPDSPSSWMLSGTVTLRWWRQWHRVFWSWRRRTARISIWRTQYSTFWIDSTWTESASGCCYTSTVSLGGYRVWKIVNVSVNCMSIRWCVGQGVTKHGKMLCLQIDGAQIQLLSWARSQKLSPSCVCPCWLNLASIVQKRGLKQVSLFQLSLHNRSNLGKQN